MAVRLRCADDLSACVTALAEVHRHDGYPTRWPADPAEWLTPKHLHAAWVAEDDGVVQGHVVVAGVTDTELTRAATRPAADLLAVSRLFVRPAGRGRRLGDALLCAATEFATQRRVGLVLEVVDERGSAAIGLYERLGWRLIGRHPAEWTDQAGARPQLRLYAWP